MGTDSDRNRESSVRGSRHGADAKEPQSSDEATKPKVQDRARQRQLRRAYKERVKPAGVFQIKNTKNGKVLLGSSLNLDGALNAHRFMLTTGAHRNKTLQQDWNECGAASFAFEVLEMVAVTDDPGFDLSDELTLLEEIWIEQLRPFGERGYNESAHIRQA